MTSDPSPSTQNTVSQQEAIPELTWRSGKLDRLAGRGGNFEGDEENS